MQLSRTPALIAIGLLAGVVAALQYVAFAYFFYWTIWWYDIMMHGLGGMLIGSLAAWFFMFLVHSPLGMSRFLFIVSITFAVGVFWEVFEYLIGSQLALGSFALYISDTLSDIGMDVAGALLAFLMVRRFVAQP